MSRKILCCVVCVELSLGVWREGGRKGALVDQMVFVVGGEADLTIIIRTF